MAMTFGCSTMIDAPGWAIAALPGLKVMANIVLLRRPGGMRFRAGWSVALRPATKVTPILAVPCMIAIALSQRKTGEAWACAALMIFIVVAVPIVIWRRFGLAPPSGRSIG